MTDPTGSGTTQDSTQDSAGGAGDASGLPAELLDLRASIDNIDAALIHLLAERFRCTQRVGRLKADRGLPPADPGREAAQIARLRSLAVSADLDPAIAEKFLTFVVAEVIRHHVAIAAGDDGAAAAGAPTGTDSHGSVARDQDGR